MSPLRVNSYLDHLGVIDVLLRVRPQQAEMVVCRAQRAVGHMNKTWFAFVDNMDLNTSTSVVQRGDEECV